MSRRKMSFGQRLVELLKQENVQVIFSQGDVTMRDIQKHAERQGLKIVGPRHEAAAVFMADGYYRMSGKPQAVIGAMGPGQANLLPSVACAAQEHIPVIVFGSRRQNSIDNKIRRSRFLHAPTFDCFAKLCKFAGKIYHPSELDEMVYEAFRKALTGTPGPVYLEYDYVMHESEWDYPDMVPPERYRVLQHIAPPSVLDQAVRMLAEAKCPILLAGTGIQTSRTQGLFERLALILGCPVMTTMGGSGALPETDEKWFSYYSATGKRILEECDLVLALGTSIPETINYGKYRNFSSGNEKRKWILVEQDSAAVGVNHPIDLPIIGKLESVLPALCDALEATSKRAPNKKLSSWRQAYSEEKHDSQAAITVGDRINPSQLMIEARAAVPDNAVIVVDGGMTLLQQLAFFEKRSRDYIASSKFAHLGSGMPLAIGAQLCVGKDTPVCLVTGDGALGFHFMEFETAVRHNLPIVIIVNDDQALGAEMQAHHDHIGHTIEVSFSPVRYDLMAEAIGGHGEFVDKVEGIQDAILRAFASNVPSIVQVSVDPESAIKFTVPHLDELGSWLFDDA